MSKWQPIGTAPKDGEVVDLWCRPSHGLVAGSYGRVADCWFPPELTVTLVSDYLGERRAPVSHFPPAKHAERCVRLAGFHADPALPGVACTSTDILPSVALVMVTRKSLSFRNSSIVSCRVGWPADRSERPGGDGAF
jgi:hypothetical protein